MFITSSRTLFSIMLGLVITTVTHAAVMVTGGDISGNSYEWRLSYADMANTTKFDQAVIENTGNATGDDSGWQLADSAGGGDTYWRPYGNTQTEASFTLKWDLSGSGYEIVGGSFRESIRINGRTIDVEGSQVAKQSTITVAYSTDGVNFTTLRSESSPSSGSGTNDTVDSNSFVLSEATQQIYYRIEGIATVGDLRVDERWNFLRNADEPDEEFLATFNVAPVPEPGSLMLIGLGSLALLGRRRAGV